MGFKSKDPGGIAFIPTTTPKKGFQVPNVPKEIFFEKTKLNVDICIPSLRQCANCGKLGLTKFVCKSKKKGLNHFYSVASKNLPVNDRADELAKKIHCS